MRFLIGSVLGVVAAAVVSFFYLLPNSTTLSDSIAQNITNMRGQPFSQTPDFEDVYARDFDYGRMAPSRSWSQHLDILNDSVPANCLIGKRYLQGLQTENLLGELTETQAEVSNNIATLCHR